MDQEQNPAISKILEYAKDKSIITWDEISVLVGQDFVNSPEMEKALQILHVNKIQVVESGLDDEDDDVDIDDDDEDDDSLIQDEDVPTDDEDDKNSSRSKLVNGDKESSVDDPIRLYLREIGKENLLTAEQEVILSKKMEDGKNIIKDVILNSGIMIPEFFAVAQKAFTRIDIHEPGRPRKEINEEMAEKRRLKSCYSEFIKPVLSEILNFSSSMTVVSDSFKFVPFIFTVPSFEITKVTCLSCFSS